MDGQPGPGGVEPTAPTVASSPCVTPAATAPARSPFLRIGVGAQVFHRPGYTWLGVFIALGIRGSGFSSPWVYVARGFHRPGYTWLRVYVALGIRGSGFTWPWVYVARGFYGPRPASWPPPAFTLWEQQHSQWVRPSLPPSLPSITTHLVSVRSSRTTQGSKHLMGAWVGLLHRPHGKASKVTSISGV